MRYFFIALVVLANGCFCHLAEYSAAQAMLHVVAGVTNKPSQWKETRPLEQWNCVVTPFGQTRPCCQPTNKSGARALSCVFRSYSRMRPLIGTLNLAQLPSTTNSGPLISVDFSRNQLFGSADLSSLPPTLTALDLSENRFSGPVNLTCLPSSLHFLNLSVNRFSGILTLNPDQPLLSLNARNNVFTAVNFRSLPATLQTLDVSVNQLRGVLPTSPLFPQFLQVLRLKGNDFRGDFFNQSFPRFLSTLDIGNNRFSGEINFSRLPATLRALHAEGNEFTGWLNFALLPPLLQTLDLTNNQLYGELEIDLLRNASLQAMLLGGNRLSGTLELCVLPASLHRLDVRNNNFSGSIDLTALPTLLERLHLDGNRFQGQVDLTRLPMMLASLSLARNQFSGPVSFRSFWYLWHLDLSNNFFVGAPDLSHLPPYMTSLNLSFNNFSGPPLLHNLPPSLNSDRWCVLDLLLGNPRICGLSSALCHTAPCSSPTPPEQQCARISGMRVNPGVAPSARLDVSGEEAGSACCHACEQWGTKASPEVCGTAVLQRTEGLAFCYIFNATPPLVVADAAEYLVLKPS